CSLMRRSISNIRNITALVALAALLSARPRLAAQGSDNSGALFLTLPVGTQAVGMGQTAVTLEGRGEAVFWNPAGLATIGSNEFTIENATLAAGNAHAVTAYFPTHRFGVIGAAVNL